jgi:nucleoredoxin
MPFIIPLFALLTDRGGRRTAIEGRHRQLHAFFMRGIVPAIAAWVFLIPRVLPAQNAPTAGDNPMAGLTIDGTNVPPAKPLADNVAAAALSFLEKFKGHLEVLKDGHLQPADAGALNGVKYITVLYSSEDQKTGRGIMETALPFYYSLKRKHPEYAMIFVDNRDSAESMEHFIASFKMPWLVVRSEDARSDVLNLGRYNSLEYIPDLILFDSTGKILSDSVVNGNWVGVEGVMQDTEKTLPESSESP